jgi:hypothetical protein
MAARIDIHLAHIKQHLLTCLGGLYQCGYANVKQLMKDVSLHDISGNREYQDVRFSDMLGNYFWIEKDSDVAMIGSKRLDNCGGAILTASQRFALFSMVKGADEAKVFECIVGCLGAYGCGVEGVKLSVTGGEYDSFAVLQKALPAGTEIVLQKIGNFALTKVEFRIEYLMLPTTGSGEECECEACKDC